MKLLVTGGAGFIGSAFIRRILSRDSDARIINLDKLTYAGNLENLVSVKDHAGYRFVHGDICDQLLVERLIVEDGAEAIVHFAAESHVDRSIHAPAPVFETNLRGTFSLLEAARAQRVKRFVHVSTDEVYGSIDLPAEADETFPLRPSSPYSAAKAGSDLLALSYFTTYKQPVMVTRASNNYGPFQFPEKLIPLMISRALDGQPLPVYGDGRQVRDWLYVEDHCAAIEAVLQKGREGQVYNIGGNRSLENITVVERILAGTGQLPNLIQYVADRPGHDRRYALSSEKMERETGWKPEMDFESGLSRTIAWYQDHADWVGRIKSGEYQQFYQLNYGSRT